MKTFNDLFKSNKDIEERFRLDPGYLKKNDLITIYAQYNYEDYSGGAFLLFWHKKSNRIFEVNGSHCSCYGLEGQFTLEPTKLRSVVMRESSGRYNYKDIAKFASIRLLRLKSAQLLKEKQNGNTKKQLH